MKPTQKTCTSQSQSGVFLLLSCLVDLLGVLVRFVSIRLLEIRNYHMNRSLIPVVRKLLELTAGIPASISSHLQRK